MVLALPFGISFYTFQSMSYTIDVYRGELRPARSYLQFLFYVSFFPQLVAGPIVRARDFLYQIPRQRKLRAAVFLQGSYFLVQGFLMKMVLADNLAAYVNTHWNAYIGRFNNPFCAIVLAFFFGCQILCDFAGYSQIARGAALLLGFTFMENFNYPYIATSFADFWKRWHISLSRWFRDYLYIPLGGNRISRTRTYANLLMVMIIAGLWHGAAFGFVVWGLLHGLGLVGERILVDLGLLRSRWSRFAWFFVVQACVLVGWIFFRSDTVTAWECVVGFFSSAWHPVFLPEWERPLLFASLVVIAHGVALLEARLSKRVVTPALQAVAAGAMCYLMAVCYASTSDFIYFHF
jgi:D-alanyl-lipoteichoic acid acyltransferase DltB (MBOAT superfamily)